MIVTRARRLGDASGQSVDIVLRDGLIEAIVPAGSALTEGQEVIDVDDRVVMPGLWDEHVHFSLWAQHRRQVSLHHADSAAQAARIMADAVEANASSEHPDPVVIGAGYRDGLWKDAKTTQVLDALTGDTPVVLISVDVHSCWANTAALDRFGVLGHRDDGVITEREWFALSQQLSDVDATTIDGWVLDAAHHAASRGVVGIVDLEMTLSAPDWIRRVASYGARYPLTVECGVYPEDLETAIAQGLRSGLELAPGVTVGPFKIITDGSLNTRTAQCVEPYLGVEGEHYGALNWPPEDIEAMLVAADKAGFWLAVHAIGDKANQTVLDIFEKNDLHGRIEHAQLVRAEDFERFARLGVTASVQPDHAIDDRDVTDVYWADRAERAFALRSLVEHGAQVVLGSDAPVSPLDPWITIASAVTRTREGREPWHLEQGLTISEALSFSTRSTLEVGQPADLIALDADPLWLVDALGSDLAKASDALRELPVALTVAAGAITHRHNV